jgi:N-methylhydantoinase A
MICSRPAKVLVERRAIVEVEGRIDYRRNVLVPLNEEQVVSGTRHLVDEVEVEALAVCFLTSYLNPEHELRAASLIRQLYPNLFASLSHQVYRLLGENRRWTTAVLNSFVQAAAQTYLNKLSISLTNAGLTGSVAFFQGLGGVIGLERAERFPLTLLGSGPAGGALGANALAKRMGAEDVLIGDMGGTSFDTGMIRANELHVEKNIELGQFKTGVNLVDIISVGAGGGSIASVSERGVPQVGPRSAGSTPGPACYGRGGEEPTVTDAMVVLGLIDPENYLGGRMKLDVICAREPYRSSPPRSLGRLVSPKLSFPSIAPSSAPTASSQLTLCSGSIRPLAGTWLTRLGVSVSTNSQPT